MHHVPYKSLLAILNTVKELGGRPDRETVHKEANLYRSLQGTIHRLEQLNRLELVHRQSNGKEFVYFLSAKGKRLLNLSTEEQMDALKRRYEHVDAPRWCCVCYSREQLQWYRGKFYCAEHLNSDLEEPQAQVRTASSLALW